MPLPIVFAGLPAGDNPAALLDQQFQALSGFAVIPCFATGQNVIQLQPFFDAPTVNEYTDLSPVFSFVAAVTCSGNVTLNVNGLGEHPAYKANGGTLVVAGDIQAGLIYQAQFLTSLDGGAGGFVVNVGGGGGGGGGGGPDLANVIMTAFTGNGAFTPNPNLIAVIVEGMGGGGGGGNANAPSGKAVAGGGGGSGGYFKAYLTPALVGPSQTVTIGAGGAPQASGGTTSFGALCTAQGGQGAPGNDSISTFGNAGLGGPASLGGGVAGIAITGAAGQWGQSDFGPLNMNIFSGTGGQIMGGAGPNAGAYAGTPQTVIGAFASPNSGAGGGGGISIQAAGVGAGGNGAAGWMLVTAYYSA